MKRGFTLAMIAAVFGGIALLIVFAGLMFIATFWFLGESGRGGSVEWDEAASQMREPEDPDRVAPRIIIRGQKVDGGCHYFLRLGITEDGVSTHARTVEEDRGDCKKVIEVWTAPN